MGCDAVPAVPFRLSPFSLRLFLCIPDLLLLASPMCHSFHVGDILAVYLEVQSDFLCSSGTCLEIHDARMYMLIPGLSIMYNTPLQTDLP